MAQWYELADPIDPPIFPKKYTDDKDFGSEIHSRYLRTLGDIFKIHSS
jgi:hypothetical protein